MVVISTMEHLPDACCECPCFVDIREYGEACLLYDGSHDGSTIDRLCHCPLKEVVLYGQGDRDDADITY